MTDWQMQDLHTLLLLLKRSLTQLRKLMGPLEKIAARSARNTKIALTTLTELTNRLESMDISKPSVSIRPTGLDKSLGRFKKSMLENKSPLNHIQGRKATTKPTATGTSGLKKKRTTNPSRLSDDIVTPCGRHIRHTHVEKNIPLYFEFACAPHHAHELASTPYLVSISSVD